MNKEQPVLLCHPCVPVVHLAQHSSGVPWSLQSWCSQHFLQQGGTDWHSAGPVQAVLTHVECFRGQLIRRAATPGVSPRVEKQLCSYMTHWLWWQSYQKIPFCALSHSLLPSVTLLAHAAGWITERISSHMGSLNPNYLTGVGRDCNLGWDSRALWNQHLLTAEVSWNYIPRNKDRVRFQKPEKEFRFWLINDQCALFNIRQSYLYTRKNYKLLLLFWETLRCWLKLEGKTVGIAGWWGREQAAIWADKLLE